MTAEHVDDQVHMPVPVAPLLVHAGTYALYQTPGGGRHLVYRRERAFDPETGQVREIADCPDAHLPDIPPEAIPLIEAFAVNGIPAPVLALLQGKMSPLKIMAALRETSNGQDG